MKKILALLFLLLPSLAFAQTNGQYISQLPLTSGNLFVGSSSNFAAGVPLTGDCYLVSSGAITCTKTNGVALRAIANGTDTTSTSLPAQPVYPANT